MWQERLDKSLVKIIKYLLPFIFLLPFIISQDYYFPYITPRNFLFRIIISIVLALYIYLFFRHKEKYSFGHNKIVIAYFIFGIILTVSSILAGDFWYSFWSNHERMDGLITLYYLIAFLLVLLGMYRDKKDWLNLIRISVFSSLPMAIISLSQHWGVNIFLESAGGERVTSTLGNATYLAVFSLFNFFFAIYLLLRYKGVRPKLELWLFYALDVFLLGAYIIGKKLIYPNSQVFESDLFFIRMLNLWLLFIIPQIFINLQYYFHKFNQVTKYAGYGYLIMIILLNFIALSNAQTRGVLVGIFMAVIFVSIFLLFSKYVARKIKYIILLAFILVSLFIVNIFVFKDSNFVKNNDILRRVTSISLSDTTAETRLLTWRLSLKAFYEKPVLGWGQENFYVVFNKYFPNDIFKSSGSSVWFDRPHNVFLQQLVEGGILGLLSYLFIFFWAFLNFWRHYKKTKDPITISVLGGLLIAYLVQNFFVFDSINSYVPIILLLAISVFLAGDFKANKKFTADKYLAVGLSSLILIVGFYLNIPEAKANKDFITNYNNLRIGIGLGTYQKEDVNKLLSVMESQYLGRFELRQVYSEFVASLIQSRAILPSDTLYFIDKAEDAMLRSIEEQPQNVRHHVFLINLYFYSSILDKNYSQKAVDLIEDKSLPLSPTRVQLYYYLGSFYMNLGKYDLSMENFVKGRDLAPYVFESYYNLIMGSLAKDDIELAQGYFDELIDNVDVIESNDYLRLAGVYDYFGYTEQAKTIGAMALENIEE